MFKEEVEREAALRGVLITSPRTQSPIRLPPTPGGHSDLVGAAGLVGREAFKQDPQGANPSPTLKYLRDGQSI